MRLSPRFNKIAAVLAALVVVTVGYFLLTTQAAVTYGSLESEDGVLASGATVASDTNASGGKYVQLTTSTSTSSGNSTAAKCADIPNLQFCDDFDGAANSYPDSSKWNIFTSGSSWGSQCWKKDPANISMDGQGHLRQTVVNTGTTQCTNSYGDSSTYTSGGMDTSGKFNMGMGKVEIRAKLSCADGIWGSFWMSTGSGPSWPQSGEIDIYELGYNKLYRLQQTVHVGTSNSDHKQKGQYVDLPTNQRWCDDYHVYGAEKQQNVINFWVDGKITNKVVPADFPGYSWPFNTYNNRILIDQQYSKNGKWSGDINPSQLPTTTLIDYVRVYKDGASSTTGSTTTTTKATDTVTVSVPSTGTYKVWSRVQVPSTSNNSYDLQVDGGTTTTVSTGTTGSWVWVAAPASLSLTSGSHTAKLTANGNGVKVDRVMFLSDTGCTPTGTGTNCQSSADTAKPVVALTAPTNGSSISGTTIVNATASDDVGVTSVSFYVDNALKSTDNSAPYTYSLDTAGLSVGSHALVAKATDATGNVGSSDTVTINVSKATTSGTPINNGCAVNSIYVNSCRPWLGVATGGYPQVSGGSGSLSQMQFFNKRLNNPSVLNNPSATTTLTYKMDSPHVYHTPGKVMLGGDAKAIAADNSLVGDSDAPMIINYKPGSKWADTAAGKDDADLITSAKAIKAIAPKHVILSLWHEPENGQLSSAGLTITGSCKMPNGNIGSAADYRAMYRHVHDVFQAQGVTNVAWGINYMGYSAWDCVIKDMWPGNDIIDWVLWDPYGGDTTSFQNTISRFYNVLEKNTDATHNFTSKAWGIAETSTHSLGSNAADWWNAGISSIGSNWNTNKFPRVKLYAVFDNPNGNSQNRIGYDEGTTVNVAEQTAFDNWAKNLLKFNGSGTSTADTQAPTTPANLKSTNQTTSSISLSWTASTDNVGVAGYRVFRDGTQIADITNNTYINSGLKASTAYSYRVAAYDTAGNVSVQSSSLSVSTTAAPDTTAPAAPTGLTAGNVTQNSVSLSWKASTDNVGVSKYIIQRNQVTVAEVTTTSYNDTQVSAGSNYSYVVLAADAAGNVSGASNTASVTTPKAPDTTPPSKPTNVSTIAVSPTQVNVTWTASTDNVGVTSYNVLRDGKVIGQVSTNESGSATQFGDATVVANTSYSYTIVALDAAGNISQTSAASQITTPSTGTLTGKKGVWAQYYANKDLGGTPVASRQEASINYDWGTNAPITTVPADNFSAAWTGRILAPKTGTYTLYTQSDDGVRLYIDNTLVIDDWTTHSKKENSATISFDAGSKYNFRLEYFEKTGSATVSLLWSGPGISKQIIPTANLLPQQYGLTGTYYSDPRLSSVSFARLDQTVNFDWATGSPSKQLLPDNFSVRWTGQIYIPTTATYTFYSTSDDGVRLIINNKQIFKNWNEHSAKEVSGNIALTGGQKYDVTLEYYEAKGDASVNLKWSSPNIKKQIIDRSALRDRW